ncbi:hypothetical protein [Streptomyces pratensis]|uniref:hypothetical protein n=1 Tax=Streptomyces pratensis TaxID=1169025 RepID=UPI00301984DC
MRKVGTFTAVGMSAAVVATLGVAYTGATATASQPAAVAAAPADVYKATSVSEIGAAMTQVVALSLPAGTYTLTGSAHLVYADKASCYVTGGPSMATPRGNGYNEASLSATGVVTLAKTAKVQLMCGSEKVLPMPQDPHVNGTLVATRAAAYQNQGTGAP